MNDCSAGFDVCIAALARSDPFMAFANVPTGICSFWAESLGWPEWLAEGTAFAGARKLPSRIRLVDDLRIVGNLIEKVGEDRLVEMIFDWDRFPGDVAVLSAPDLEAALVYLLSNVERANPPIKLHFKKSGRDARLSWAIDPRIKPFGRIYEQVVMAVLFRVVRSFVGLKDDKRDALREVTLGPACSPEIFARLVPCRVVQAPGDPYMMLTGDALAIANPGFNPAMWDEILTRNARGPGEREGRPIPAVEAVEAALAIALRDHGRVLQFAEIARSLDRSERTLARDLAKAGVTYRKLIDRVRMTMAQDLLLGGGLTVTEAASRLGYSDDSSFVRSFRRHFGISPARWCQGERLASSKGDMAA
ncbi:MAG: AraC family transcriptional regulator [Erythrobacter sp.]|uniref:helix-turn-helix transcriptional regulator n=1 Tax=Erythrobacter sp. TaxID=1042 RepID=UPI0032EDD41E